MGALAVAVQQHQLYSRRHVRETVALSHTDGQRLVSRREAVLSLSVKDLKTQGITPQYAHLC